MRVFCEPPRSTRNEGLLACGLCLVRRSATTIKGVLIRLPNAAARGSQPLVSQGLSRSLFLRGSKDVARYPGNPG